MYLVLIAGDVGQEAGFVKIDRKPLFPACLRVVAGLAIAEQGFRVLTPSLEKLDALPFLS